MAEANEELSFKDLLANRAVGNTLAILAGLVFLFLCMILPLVGPAGAATPYATANFIAFLGVLLLALVLSGLATWSKLQCRKVDGSPFPLWSAGLTGVLVFLLLMLLTGMLKI